MVDGTGEGDQQDESYSYSYRCLGSNGGTKAVAVYLTKHQDAIDRFLLNFKTSILIRLERIFDGIQELRKLGHSVDAIAPQAAIYLTIKMDLAGKVTGDGIKLENQADVTSYLLDEAKLAIVPFYAFGT